MPQASGKLNKNKKGHRVTKRQTNLRKAAPLQLKPKSVHKGLHLHKLSSKYSITEQTEKLVASKVGHLEVLKGTRKEIEKQKKQKALKDAKKGK
ncbi:hypothetical protein ACO0RG_000132 [Hanseniaspora osmophila]|uniref:Uncharacterized protein n=1 Tax=Hanseniaspora osmophila TaxID=56408 RepID=A0A1E5R5E5_9ASCO|nr:Uncharacterized protein AWRI3579_g3621 [Hanseniaspora osmophila]